MSGILYGLGVGPGDPDLLTIKAARILMAVPVVAYPAPLEGESLARSIAAPHIPAGKTEIAIRLAMTAERSQANQAYDQGAKEIAKHLEAGRDVAVLCEGDPLFFGSFAYLLERLAGSCEIRIVPGVSSLGACSALSQAPLVTQEEMLAVIPATRSEEEIARLLEKADAAAIMKVGRHLTKIIRLLEKANMTKNARCVVRASMEGAKVLSLAEAEKTGVPYFSMILAGRSAA
jgi:precorrin-2/cobalt-factor-2 C20-methyltransferase